MIFTNALCEICHIEQFKVENLIAYRIRGRTIKLVELNNNQPWWGVHCVCRKCIEFLAANLLPKETP